MVVRDEQVKTRDLLSGLVLRLGLKLVIRHRHYSEDQVDQVERSKENVEDEESDIEGPGRL